jgi:PKD repeat protein
VVFTDTSTAGHDAITAWSWNFGDGATSDQQSPSHEYIQKGTYTVTLTVEDDDGDQDTETKVSYINVGNAAPAANAGGPYEGNEGSAITLDASGSSDPASDPLTYAWDLDDDGAYDDAIGLSVSNTWPSDGVYTVTVMVEDTGGLTDTNSALVTVNDVAPDVDFTAVPLSGTEPLIVDFTDASTPGPDGITAWRWDFGDGESSSEDNPSHTYDQDGTFTVTLTVTDTDGSSDTHVATDYITVSDTGPSAAFTAAPTSGNEPLTVAFTDTSTAGHDAITAWSWDFGDGAASTSQHPIHEYDQDGIYTVTLTITDTDNSSDVHVEMEFITVNNTKPNASFTANPTSGASPLTVVFADTSTSGHDPITYWLWDFGDGDTSTDQHPTHVYIQPGTYTVTLTITDADASEDSHTKVDYIEVKYYIYMPMIVRGGDMN